jgi:hypothetical protein
VGILVDLFGAAIHSAVLRFLSPVDRAQYDPPAFTQVRTLLRTKYTLFSVSNTSFYIEGHEVTCHLWETAGAESERFTVLELSVVAHSSEMFATISILASPTRVTPSEGPR